MNEKFQLLFSPTLNNLIVKKIFLQFIILLISVDSFSQNKSEKIVAYKSQPLQVQCRGLKTGNEVSKSWPIRLRNMESEDNAFPNVNSIKEQMMKEKKLSSGSSSDKIEANGQVTPIVSTNFAGNLFDLSYPSDNTIAISNGGKIVSVINSNIAYFTTAGAKTFSQDVTQFTNDNTVSSILFDPKVVYDAGADRFFMVELAGFTVGSSNILLYFSKTNNPADGWWYYTISADVNGNSTWADYPNIAVSNNEVYVTVNQFDGGDNFSDVLALQIQKTACYSGGTMNFQYYDNIQDDAGNFTFSLYPVSSGSATNYGPGVFMVGNTDPGGSNRLQLFHITNDMSSNNEQLIGNSIITTNFQIGANANQPSPGNDLDIGDCRIKGAFYQNGIVHLVFTANFVSGWNGIYYSRIITSNLSATSFIYGINGQDWGYPAVGWVGKSANDKSVVIAFTRSNSSINPQFDVIGIDDAGNSSSEVVVKQGASYIDMGQGGTERWGDYTGLAKYHSQASPTVFIFGIYGTSLNEYGNWIAKITVNSLVDVEQVIQSPETVSFFPNPSNGWVSVSFENSEINKLVISLYDMQGKLVQQLMNEEMKRGDFSFSFETNQLEKGTYVLQIQSGNKNLKNEKIVIQ